MQAEDNDGFTALMLSAFNGHDGCLRQLIAAKVRVISMRARVTRSAAPCLDGRVRVLCASTREKDRTYSSVAREMRDFSGVCVCVRARQGEGAVSRACGGVVCAEAFLSKCAGQPASGEKQRQYDLDVLGASRPRRLPRPAARGQGACALHASACRPIGCVLLAWCASTSEDDRAHSSVTRASARVCVCVCVCARVKVRSDSRGLRWVVRR